LDLHFDHPSEQLFGVRLYSDDEHWTEIGFDTNKKEFYMDRTKSGAVVDKNFPVRTKAPLAPGRPYDLTLVVDRSSLEAYAQNGTITMTNLIYPLGPRSTVRFFPISSKAVSGRGWELKSIWDQQN
jgi:fructan beta-fructosidase